MHAHSRLRIAAVGCGRVFERYHLPALRASDDWVLSAVCDTDAARLDLAGDAVPDADRAASMDDLPRDGAIDAVLITSPPSTHAGLAIAAMELGHHVLVEKPMATDITDAAAMVHAARERSRRLAVGFNRRFRRTYRSARTRLAVATADSIRFVCHTFIADAVRWAGGAEAAGATGRLDALLHDVASHQVDLVPWLLGRPIVEIRTDTTTVEPSRTIVEFEMRLEGDIVCRCRAGHDRSYAEGLEASLGRGTLSVFPGGIVESRRASGPLTRWRGRMLSMGELVAGRVMRRPNMTAESFQRQLAAFADLVRGADRSDGGAEAADGARAVAAIAACRKSLDGGGWRRVQEEFD